MLTEGDGEAQTEGGDQPISGGLRFSPGIWECGTERIVPSGKGGLGKGELRRGSGREVERWRDGKDFREKKLGSSKRRKLPTKERPKASQAQ